MTLGEDAPEVLTLFSALADPAAESSFMQLPVDGGRVAFSFQTSQVVSIASEPPVVLAFETRTERAPRGQGAGHAPAGARDAPLRRPRFVVIDDFLSPGEHDHLLAHALASRAQFHEGAVTRYEPQGDKSLVIADFARTVHGRLFESRLLTWFPLIARTLGLRMFALAPFDSRLIAAADGYTVELHSDQTPEIPRLLSCLYYLHRDPRGFGGGELRLYDRVDDGGATQAAETFTAVTPVANRLVVFSSDEFHQAMPVRCPSGEFADGRFAVTTWLRSAPRLDPACRFGWGHFRCGVVAPQFAFAERGG